MTSAVDICNLALSHIGHKRVITAIDPPDGSAEAAAAAVFYPIARDELVQEYEPTWAKTRVALADVTAAVGMPSRWRYAYAMPTDVLHGLAVLYGDGLYDEDAQEAEYEVASDGVPVIYTNVEDAVCRYMKRATDTTKFPPLFVSALSRRLASYMAGSIVKGDTGVKLAATQWQFSEALAAKFSTKDANQRQRSAIREDTQHPAPWHAARGLSNDSGVRQASDGTIYPNDENG